MIFYIGKTALALFWETIKRYVAAAMATKADKAETLAGYGIKDAYKKTDVDKLLENAAQNSEADKCFVGVIDVEIENRYDPEIGNKPVCNISNLDNVTEKGLYRLRTNMADSILNVESLHENYIVQYVLVGGLMGISSYKFVYRTYSYGEWTAWEYYDILSDKQKRLSSGDTISIRIGETLLHLTEPRLQKLQTLLDQ